MTIVGLDAGLRFGEIAVLTWGCVDVLKATLLVLDSKTRENRTVPMTDRLVKLFRSLPAGQSGELVFPNSRGGIQNFVPSSFIRGVADAQLNAGVKHRKLRVTFYTTRHSFASRLAEAGVELYRIQKLLGHSTPITTQRYAKLSNRSLRAAVDEMERLQT
jgi:integrase